LAISVAYQYHDFLWLDELVFCFDLALFAEYQGVLAIRIRVGSEAFTAD